MVLESIERYRLSRGNHLRSEIKKTEEELASMRTRLRAVEFQEAQERRRRLEAFDETSFYTRIDNLVRQGKVDEAKGTIEEAAKAGAVDLKKALGRLELTGVG